MTRSPETTRTIDHVNAGVVARYTEANGFKLAVCVGFGRDYRPRVRFFRAAADRWTQPELVDRTHLAPLTDAEVTPHQRAVLSKALEVLWATPNLGFRPVDLAILSFEGSPPGR